MSYLRILAGRVGLTRSSGSFGVPECGERGLRILCCLTIASEERETRTADVLAGFSEREGQKRYLTVAYLQANRAVVVRRAAQRLCLGLVKTPTCREAGRMQSSNSDQSGEISSNLRV